MRSIREWQLTNWLILIGVIVIMLLIGVIFYVVMTPSTFVPTQPSDQVTVPGGQLPGEQVGVPTFPQSPVEQIPLDQIQGIGSIPNLVDTTARGGITQTTFLNTQESSFISLAPNGNSLNFYDQRQQKFFRINGEGIITEISSPIFAEVQNVTYAPNGSDSILEFPDGSNIVYNFDTREQITLPQHWEDFDFSPSSSQIAFKSLALDPSERWLAISDKSGSSATRIERLGEYADTVDVDWAPNNQVVATQSEATGLTNSNLYFVGFNGENFPLSKLEGLNFEGSWNTDGSKLLYSVAHESTDFSPRVWFVNGGGNDLGQGRKSTSIQTWSHKCTFTNTTTAICGVPTEMPRGAGLIPSVANSIPDHLYQVDLTTGKSSLLAIPDVELNVQSIVPNEDGSSVFIQDRLSNKIIKMDL